MLVTCWSVKGGSGTTVVASVLALQLAASPDHEGGVLVVDLAGDVPAALGLPDPRDPGLTEWAAAGPGVAADALGRLELPAAPGLALLPRGTGPLGSPERYAVLAGLLAADPRPTVVDVGVVGPDHPALALVAQASRSLLVTRACHLALHRALRAPVRPSGVVLVSERGRAYDPSDVAAAVGAPVVAEVRVDEAVARAVDAGLLSAPVPSGLGRALLAAA